MTEVVREWSGTAAGIRWALERERACGRLVSAEPIQANDRGLVVRVVLREVEPAPRQKLDRSSTGAQQKPDRTPTRRLAVVGVSVGVGLGAAAGLVWGVVELVAWASGHVAAILGGAVLLLLVAAVLARILVGGGDSHPCNR